MIIGIVSHIHCKENTKLGMYFNAPSTILIESHIDGYCIPGIGVEDMNLWFGECGIGFMDFTQQSGIHYGISPSGTVVSITQE